MLGFIRKLVSMVKKSDELVSRIMRLEEEVRQLSEDVNETRREIAGLNALEERLEEEAVNEAHKRAMVEFDFAVKQLRKEFNEVKEIYAKGKSLGERVNELDKRVESLEHKIAWLEYYVRILWEKEMGKRFKKTLKSKCRVKVKFEGVFPEDFKG